MHFLLSLLFVVVNIALAMFLAYLSKWVLFNPKPKKFLGWHIPLTPGFIVSKRNQIFAKIYDTLQDYLNQAENPDLREGYLYEWEEQVRLSALEQVSFIDKVPLLPAGCKRKIKNAMANSAKNTVSFILRRTVPQLMEKFQLEHKLEQLDAKISSEVIYGYFREYIYKPLLIAAAVAGLLIGVINMVLYLILV
ncbi:MAG: hypothetical protein KBG06_02190 [Candidatus Syntrophosphaera sp.]|nr:hypothetical protein [Candidatus Syntrophosphaera sp.]